MSLVEAPLTMIEKNGDDISFHYPTYPVFFKHHTSFSHFLYGFYYRDLVPPSSCALLPLTLPFWPIEIRPGFANIFLGK